jgi:hypothetical protein
MNEHSFVDRFGRPAPTPQLLFERYFLDVHHVFTKVLEQ